MSNMFYIVSGRVGVDLIKFIKSSIKSSIWSIWKHQDIDFFLQIILNLPDYSLYLCKFIIIILNNTQQ